MSVPFIYSGQKIAVIVNGKSFTVEKHSPLFAGLYELIQNDADEQEVYEYLTKTSSLEAYLSDNARVKILGDKVYVDGVELHNVIVDRIRDFKNMRLPFDHLLKFIEKIQDNPSYNSRNQLYSFLENKDLVITEDGDFLAYKAVRKDYLDKYSGKISNRPGSTIKMNRNLIDDNPASHCSAGLHVGAMQYVKSYGGSDCNVVIVKVNPKNVVSVPNDHSCQKCRVCEYYVLKDADGIMNTPLYTSTGEPYRNHYVDDPLFDFADDDYEDDYEEGDVYSYYDDEDEELPPYIQL